MIRTTFIAAAMLMASAGAASAQYHPSAPQPQAGWQNCGPAHPGHPGHADCYCPQERVFYTPGAPYNVRHVVSGPAVRVYSQPVYVPSGRIDIQGPPIYVEAPPVRVAAPQIYLHAPDVRVKPSQVIVEPPQVHVAPCPGGGACQP
ncbi:MAG: hypothetical protein AB1760_19755 [Pseudomonadota bacterium]